MKGAVYMINNYAMSSSETVDLAFAGIIFLYFLISYLNVKINSIKTVGICWKNINCTRSSKGMFEYEIDGVKHCNDEAKAHIGTCKIGKKYTIYVNKKNHEKFVSKKVLIDYMIFIIGLGIPFMFLFYAKFIYK